MANKKLLVRGNYRKLNSDGIGTQIANYDIEVVVAVVQPDTVRDAVQAIIPSKVASYESLQTCYPQHDTVTDTDDKLTVDVVRGGYNPNYGAPEEKREIGPNEGMAEKAAEEGAEQLRKAAEEAADEAGGEVNPDGTVTVDKLPEKPEPGVVYEAPVSAPDSAFTEAETLTPEGTIAPGETEPRKDDDQPPAPAQ